MQVIDTHVHINYDAYDEDREQMMQRAYEAGVFKMLHSCTDAQEIPELLELSLKYDGNNKTKLFIGLGVHPTELDKWSDSNVELMQSYIDEHFSKYSEANRTIKAIGETGLDYFHEKDPELHARQHNIFRQHIALAKKNHLPLIIHTRDAWEDTLKIIEDEFSEDRDSRAGVLHCYTGEFDFAEKCINRGFYVSWSGVVTFNKCDDLRAVAAQIPLDRVLIETDCPFLAPQKVRGKRNEPSYVNYVLDTLVDCYKIPRAELAQKTTENAERLFTL